ncbi:hypothetical protein CR513_27170, partial [Mucuna pruriens]
MQNAPRTFGDTSPTFDWQNAPTNKDPSFFLTLDAWLNSKSWDLYFHYLTLVNCYPLTRLTHRLETRCKKLSHIEGSGPPRDDPKFEAWDDEDSLIITWLWNFMTPEISQNYVLYSSVREIWENLIETYSMKKDSTA